MRTDRRTAGRTGMTKFKFAIRLFEKRALKRLLEMKGTEYGPGHSLTSRVPCDGWQNFISVYFTFCHDTLHKITGNARLVLCRYVRSTIN
jgi:hypothetical protein